MAKPIKENRAKLRELMLYIAKKSEKDPRFGATKLNKLLFYADSIAYLKLGRPITGTDYQRLPNGPAPRKLLPVRSALIEGEEAAVQSRDYHGKRQERLIALRDPDLAEFTGPEIAVVDMVLELFRDEDAASISRLSHQLVGWRAFKDGDTIPYQTAFILSRKPTSEERDYALKLRPSAA